MMSKTVKEYIAAQPPKARIALEKIRQTIKKAVPTSEEVISYGMPAFKYHGMLVWFAAPKDHYALYARPKFWDKLEIKQYRTSKSTIKFPLDKPVPINLITKIVKYIAKENLKNSK
jgi:uncharacterized protein YdhG (YjbR/CyaY superfamily)